jgi:hypothetical protein
VTAITVFLYTYSALQETARYLPILAARPSRCGRRYVIAQKDATAEYLMPVRFLDDKTPIQVLPLGENIRLKMSGAGINFCARCVTYRKWWCRH